MVTKLLHETEATVVLTQWEIIEELGAKMAQVTISGEFLKYWEILGFFSRLHCILG